jgi:hypothetical protein
MYWREQAFAATACQCLLLGKRAASLKDDKGSIADRLLWRDGERYRTFAAGCCARAMEKQPIGAYLGF